jgi:hypothetical protein
MAQQQSQGGDRGRFFANGLWVAAALIVVAGFLLRSLSSILGHAELRLAGIIVIAIGILLAVIGWIGERVADRRRGRAMR